MPKMKLHITLPDRDDLVAGLSTHELHPALARAEEELAGAERDLEAARAELKRLEGEVASLPGRIRSGVAPASALAETILARDAQAVSLPDFELAVAEARDHVKVEQRRARDAFNAEAAKRRAILEKAIAELNPALEEIRALEWTLGLAIDPRAIGVGLRWVEPLATEVDKNDIAAAVAVSQRREVGVR
jgi:multidrug resistance efflux pump